MVGRRSKAEWAFEIVVLAAIFIFLLSYFKPELLLLDTTTNGGDTGSHNYPLLYLRNYLLPSGRLVGWMPDWYAGMPLFQFYFPMPFLLMALMSYAIPINIAFKIGTVLGTFLLPVAVFATAKLMKFKFPMPAVASLLTLLFLFNTGNSMWGANIPSTLAGEFSYSLGTSLVIFFLGILYAGVTSGSKKLMIVAAMVFAIATLSHAYPVFFAVVASTFFLFTGKKFKSNLIYLIKVYGLAFLLAAFWLVPMIAKSTYSSIYHYVWNLGSINDVLPVTIQPLLALSAIAGVGLLIIIFRQGRKADKKITFFFYLIFISLTLYALSPSIGVTDIRFIPFMQLFLVFPAAYGICILVDLIKRIPAMQFISLVIVLVSVIYFVSQNSLYVQNWINWNYSGYESKPAWVQLNELTTYLRGLPAGRVVHEYSNTHDKFGTPRTFESIPLFSGKPVLEGLNIESALTAPYVFVIQSEISVTPTCPIPGLVCSSFNVNSATAHLRQFNVRYVIATTNELKAALKANANYKFLKGFSEIEIYELLPYARSGYAAVAEYMPVLVHTNGNEWKSISFQWFKEGSQVPIVFSNDADPQKFERVYDSFSSDMIKSLPKVAVDNCNIKEDVQNEVVDLMLDEGCIGKPIIVRVPYFPNWKVVGADGIYLVSPAFMLIYPTQTTVKLYYSNTAVDYAGIILTLVGIAAVAVLSVKLFVKPKS